jgi:hypothetical protein
MQLRYICSHLFELLILNLIQSFLHTLEILLILLICLTNKLVYTRILVVFLAPNDPGYLELLSKRL